MGRFIELIRQAQAAGEIDAKEEAMQLGFELNSMLTLANSIYVMFGDRSAFDRARKGIRDRLARGQTRPTYPLRTEPHPTKP